MSTFRLRTLAWVVPCLMTSWSAYAQQQCYPAPEASPLLPVSNPLDILVEADDANLQRDKLAEFSGGVEIQHRASRIQADQATIDKLKEQLQASGDVQFQNEQIQVDSDHIDLNLTSGRLLMTNTQYQLLGFTGRGLADTISLGEDGIKLNDVSFSTCAPGEEDWLVKASSIELEAGEVWGKAKHTRFYVAGVPVLYLPYFAFPVTEQRQTGLLFPIINSTARTGVTYEQPFYWNIAPNFDATISPRLMSKRGTQIKTEFRYLMGDHAGQVNLEYLPSDNDTVDQEDRYFYRYQHFSNLSDQWQLRVDYNGLSDDNYIVDLGNDFYNRADTHLFQTVGLNYFSEELDFSATFRDYELIGNSPSTYRALPEMQLQYRLPLFDAAQFTLDSELAYFTNSNSANPDATRLHISPSISLPYQSESMEWLAEARVLQTFYYQEQLAGFDLQEHVSRTLGQVRLYGGLNFERDIRWEGKSATQTLEPRIQYLYTSFEDQSRIGIYDTFRLLNDYAGLFRGQDFSGLDRISDNNQITVGVTSRIFDESNREQLAISVGQIFYFEDNTVTEAINEESRSSMAAEVDWRISSKWSLQSRVQISSDRDKVEQSNLSLDYQFGENKIVQLNHRYVRNLSGEEIDQIGIVASWPINQEWHWVGRWYKDRNLQRSVESYMGLQYESCCWALQVVASRQLINRFDVFGQQGTNDFESGISLNFVFKGMGGRNTARDMLSDGLFGYRQPYLLTN